MLKGYEKERDDGNVCFIREKDRSKKKRITIWSIHKAECYKLFVAERGWLICIVFIISAMLVSRWDAYSVTMGEYYYRYYAQMFEGNITEKTLERIEQEQKYIEQEEDVMMHDEKENVSLMQTVLLKYSLIAIGLAIITIVASAISYKISNRAMAVVLNMILFGLPILGANVTALLI